MNKKINLVYQTTHEITGDDILVDISLTPGNESKILHEWEKMLWQAKETLKAQDHKQKTWDQREESQEDPQEQESSTHNNDQTSPEKEQRQRTRKTNNKQYIVSYPDRYIRGMNDEITTHAEMASNLLEILENGDNVTMPNDWKVQVIDL